MKHLDEGTLQAWLDLPRSGLDPSEVAEIEGHLAACASCASELAALRGSDDRVHQLLAGGVDRDVERPPFEDIVARSRGHRGGHHGRLRLQRMAWAASVVLALGVGWMTNEVYRSAPPSPALRVPAGPADVPVEGRGVDVESPAPAFEQAPAESRADAPASPAEVMEVDAVGPVDRGAEAEQRAQLTNAAPASATDADAAASRVDDVATVAGGGAGGAQPAAPATGPDPAPLRSRQQNVPEPTLADAAADAATVDAVSRDERAGALAIGPTVVTGYVRNQDGGPVPAAQVYVEGSNVGVLSEQDGAYQLSIPNDGSDSVRMSLVVARLGFRSASREIAVAGGDAAVADFNLQEEAVRLDEVVARGDAVQAQRRAIANALEPGDSAPFLWRGTTPERAELALGRVPVVVPWLPVLSMEIAETDDGNGGNPVVRVLQALGEDGAVLTLVEGRSIDDRDRWPVASARSIESRRVGDLLITGAAPLASDSLRTLLGALR